MAQPLWRTSTSKRVDQLLPHPPHHDHVTPLTRPMGASPLRRQLSSHIRILLQTSSTLRKALKLAHYGPHIRIGRDAWSLSHCLSISV